MIPFRNTNSASVRPQDFISFFENDESKHLINSHGYQPSTEKPDPNEEPSSIDCLPDGSFLPQNKYNKKFKKAKK